MSGGLWTDDDLNELVKLIKRYPGGTPERWEKIADHMCRTVNEVTYMANRLKDRFTANYDEEPQEAEAPRKVKTRGGKAPVTETVTGIEDWTQTQQKALEAALAKYPKGPADRWEKIAKCVPSRTKEECMMRYKHLADLVRKKKEQEVENDKVNDENGHDSS